MFFEKNTKTYYQLYRNYYNKYIRDPLAPGKPLKPQLGDDKKVSGIFENEPLPPLGMILFYIDHWISDQY